MRTYRYAHFVVVPVVMVVVRRLGWRLRIGVSRVTVMVIVVLVVAVVTARLVCRIAVAVRVVVRVCVAVFRMSAVPVMERQSCAANKAPC